MFEVKVEGGDDIARKLDAEIAKLASLHQVIPEEMVNWQREDMHRRFPNIEVEGTTATTKIWPRSRLPAEHHHKGPNKPGPKGLAGPKLAAPKTHTKGGGRPSHSTRPILRPQLEARLFDRIISVVEETLKWP
jgi:hypothetical protein